jgi:prolipoprotein diacylglyceryl transferase
MNIPKSIPSPGNGVLQLGPIPIRGYAIMIIIGIAVAIWLGNKRWVARGGLPGQVSEVAMWAVPFGVVGGRIYHVLTDWSAYFGVGGRGFWATLKIWQGGLGIWGAIALGAAGAFIGCVRQGMKLAAFADAIAPGLVFAQAIGRWGNWFNQELFGRPTSMPWGLEIDQAHRPLDYINSTTFQPTFLYESIACTAIGFFLLWADRKFVFGHGRLFALYLAIYCASRGLIETVRIDEANHIFGIRLNVFTSIFVGIGAMVYYVRSVERFPGQEMIESGLVVGLRTEEEVKVLRAESRIKPDSVIEAAPAHDNETVAKPIVESPAGPRRGRRVAPKE